MEATIDSLWEAQTKTTKKDYLTKNLFSPTFYDINTSKFQDMFLDMFKKSVGRNFLKIKNKILQKNNFYFYFCYKIFIF